ncbi:hypothetical protein HOY80DRAFT_924939 [Tuber brumale]|nr:hypothetical protein HOY80DRAFT_924939 [Tuber brumale]
MREALGTIHIALLHLTVNQIVKTISFPSILLSSLRQRVLVLEYSFLHKHANLNPSPLSFHTKANPTLPFHPFLSSLSSPPPLFLSSFFRLNTHPFGCPVCYPANMSHPTTTSPRKAPGADWEKKADEAKLDRAANLRDGRDLNNPVMNYLTTEGHKSAAANSAQEANMPHQADPDPTQEWADIRHAIHHGDIQTATERTNELHPELLETNLPLHFSLLRLQLIELIRNCAQSPDGDISEALAFATTHLAPRAPGNSKFLQDLERTMALLCFPMENLAPPLVEMMDPALRRQVAAKVNEAILEVQGVPKEAKIRRLVRLRAWAEQRMRSERRDMPNMNLGLDVASQTSDDAMGA